MLMMPLAAGMPALPAMPTMPPMPSMPPMPPPVPLLTAEDMHAFTSRAFDAVVYKGGAAAIKARAFGRAARPAPHFPPFPVLSLLQPAVAWALERCTHVKQVEQLALYLQTRALAPGAVPSAPLHCLYFLSDYFHHWWGGVGLGFRFKR